MQESGHTSRHPYAEMHISKVPPVQTPLGGCGIGPAATIGREEAAVATAKRLSLIFIYFFGWYGISFCLESGRSGVDAIREKMEWVAYLYTSGGRFL